MASRVPPNSPDVERAILGGLILKPEYLCEVARVVSGKDFYIMANRFIYEAIEALFKDGSPVDAVTIYERMRQAGQEKSLPKGAIYISQLTDDIVPSNSIRYAEDLRKCSRRRAMIAAAQAVTDEGFDETKDPEEYIDRARRAIAEVADNNTESRIYTLEETIDDTLKDFLSDEAPDDIIKTGFHAFDSEFGGIMKAVTTVVAARPSMGKSTFLLNVAVNVANAGRRVLFVSLEDKRKILQARLLAKFSKIDSRKIIFRKLSFEEKMKVSSHRDLVACLPIHIDDGAPYTSEQIRNRVLSAHMRTPFDLVVVDHLHHVADRGKNEYETTSNAMKTLNEIPNETGTALLLAAQLNRDLERRENKEPTMADLRNAGKIEEAARLICFLHRPFKYDETEDPHKLMAIVGKSNHGPTGKKLLRINLPTLDIQDWNGSQYSDTYGGTVAGEY